MNLLELPEKLPPEELCETLWQNKHVRIERICSAGQVSPPDFWYDQEEAEWLVILQGTGEVEFADGRIARLNSGDTLLIPAHARHRVRYTSTHPPCIWLCIFTA